MASVATGRGPRYGSAAELATYAGVSVKTVRRLVGSGKVRAFKLGRRTLIPFADFEAHILKAEGEGSRTMQASPTLTTPFVPPISAEELARRNASAVALLDELEADVAGEEDQRETLEVLRRALGPDRVASSRPALL